MKKTLLLIGLALGCCRGLWAAPPTATPTPVWTGVRPGTVLLELEAENFGTISSPMATGSSWGSSSTISNGSFISTGTANSGSASFTFKPFYTGDYMLEALVYATNNSSNEFFVGASVNDTGGSGSVKFDLQTSSSSTWRYVTNDTSGNVNDTAANARVWTLTAGTTYTFTFTGRDLGTCLDAVRLYIDPDDMPAASPSSGTGTGLCGQYWSQPVPPAFSGTANWVTVQANVDYDWGTSSPGGGIAADAYGVRWSGELQAPYSGFYNFETVSDEGVRLWVNGVQVVNNWTAHSSATDSGWITLTANTKYTLTLEYYEGTATAAARLRWYCIGVISPMQAVPVGRLYNSSCAVSTPFVPTITPTPTVTPTPVTPIYQGLSITTRLNGLEYIPFPPVSNGGSTFYDLAVSFTTAAANEVPKNTARWKVELVGLSATVGSDQIAVETRLGPIGVSCTTGYYNINDYATATLLALPPRPQNLSSTYFWLTSTAVPVTERIDAFGDPQYTPYLDALSLPSGQAFADNYCWYCKDLSDTTEYGYQSVYAAFMTQARSHNYNSQPILDVPKLFRLWREGVVLSRSIYTSMTGWSSYYIGAGGEIGGDSANKLTSGVPAYNGPWNASGSSGHDEITGAGTMVRSSTWFSRPAIGELWPDNKYSSDWSSTGGMATWGNLRNTQQSGVAYRDNRDNFDVTTAGGLMENHAELHRTSSMGCGSFMNGNAGSNTFNHTGLEMDPVWLNDAQVVAQDYNFAMPATFHVNRPFGLNYGGNTPTEWSLAPYNARRLTLNMYTASTQAAATTPNEGYYAWAGTSNDTQRASAAVRGIWNSNAGFFVMNGLAPSTDSGINFVARFALLSCLRTFHEAGAPAASSDGVFNGRSVVTTNNRVSGVSYRIEPIPYVDLYEPTLGQDLDGISVIPLKWKQRFVRWDGNRYSENYPLIDAAFPPSTAADPSKPGNPNLEWHSLTGTALVFNLKYSTNAGGSWKSCLTNRTGVAGEYMDDAADSIPGTASPFYSYNWDVSALGAGSKLVRVECYRPSFPQHYGYHEVSVVTNP